MEDVEVGVDSETLHRVSELHDAVVENGRAHICSLPPLSLMVVQW